MSSTEEDSEMSYDSSCSGDSFIDAIEEENGVSRMVIIGSLSNDDGNGNENVS